jgi:hypothetical protein
MKSSPYKKKNKIVSGSHGVRSRDPGTHTSELARKKKDDRFAMLLSRIGPKAIRGSFKGVFKCPSIQIASNLARQLHVSCMRKPAMSGRIGVPYFPTQLAKGNSSKPLASRSISSVSVRAKRAPTGGNFHYKHGSPSHWSHIYTPHRSMANHRHKKIIKLAKGYRGRANRCFTVAIHRVRKARQYAYRDRKTQKRNIRKLWIQRINAGSR